MNEKLKAKREQQLEAMFTEMTKVIKVLKRDLDFSLAVLKKDPANQMLRRITIRNFCAFAEGCIHTLKSLSLQFHNVLAAGLASEEIDALRELTSAVDSGGRAKSRRMHIPFADNFRFTCNIYRRIFHCAYAPDFRGSAWQNVLSTFEVRDRLMHPKVHQSVEVQDDEIVALQDALGWLKEVWISLQDQWDFAKIEQRGRDSTANKCN